MSRPDNARAASFSLALALAPLALGALAWAQARDPAPTAAWRAHSQQAARALPSCAAAAAAGAEWARLFPSARGDPQLGVHATYFDSHARFDLLPPVWGGAPLVSYGPPRDGHKKLLDVSYLNAPRAGGGGGGGAPPPPCVIFSLGGNEQTEFEEAMLAATTCDVVTVDCSVSVESMDAIIARTPQSAGRFFFRPYCLGAAGATAVVHGTRVALRSAASVLAELGRTHLAILKMDIEEGEHAALPAFLRDAAGALPSQISMELRWPLHARGVEPLAVARDLVRAGYVLASREDNPFCFSCTELTWVKGCGAPVA